MASLGGTRGGGYWLFFYFASDEQRHRLRLVCTKSALVYRLFFDIAEKLARKLAIAGSSALLLRQASTMPLLAEPHGAAIFTTGSAGA